MKPPITNSKIRLQQGTRAAWQSSHDVAAMAHVHNVVLADVKETDQGAGGPRKRSILPHTQYSIFFFLWIQTSKENK